MTLTKASLPSAIEVEGKLYPVRTDFRYALLLLQRIKENAPITAVDFMYKAEVPADRVAGLNALVEWINPPCKIPRPAGISHAEILLDYEQDAPLIFAAFWEMYGIDLFDETLRLHWHKFLALLAGLHDTKLNEVQHYRSYKPHKGEPAEYKREMLRLKEMWRIEEELTAEEQAAIDKFQSQLKG